MSEIQENNIKPNKYEKVIQVFAALPLLFSWLFILSFFKKDEYTESVCLNAAVGTFNFFVFAFLSFIIGMVPGQFGELAALGFHVLGTFFYLIFSIILIYKVARGKKISIFLIDKQVQIVNNLYYNTSAHSSTG